MRVRRYLTLALVSASLFIVGCATNSGGQPLSYQNIHTIDGKEKEELYTASRYWIASRFRDSSQVIEFEDPEGGSIMGNGVSDIVFLGQEIPVRFSVKIDTQDEKIRTTYNNFEMYGANKQVGSTYYKLT